MSIFGNFLTILGAHGRPRGRIFGVFLHTKNGANSEQISGSIFVNLQGGAVTTAVPAQRPFRASWHALWVWQWYVASGLTRPGPEGGRIEPAEPEPPPALFIRKVRKVDEAYV